MKSNARIVVTQLMQFSSEHKQRLDKLGDVTYYDDLAASPDDWLQRCKDADVICTGKYGFKEKWSQLHDVFVSLPFVGVGFLDPAVLKANNMTVSNSPGCNRYAVSEWVVGMVITTFRRLHELTNVDALPTNQPPQPTQGLAFKNATILGKGNVGTRVGEVLAALNMNVTYFKRGDDLATCVKDADVVIDTLSLNPSTVGLLGKEFFMSFKRGAAFVTVTSSKIVDVEAMLSALDDGQLGYVANDAGGIMMGNTDDPLYRKLLAHPKVLVTPHISYNTDVTHKISNDMMIDNVKAYLAGEPVNVLKG